MLKVNVLSSALVLSIASSSVWAAQGIYLSGEVGRSFIDMPSADNYGYYDSDLDTRSAAFRLAVGYSKDMNPDFGLGGELGYNNYGSDTYEGYTLHNYRASFKYKYSAIDLLGKFTWHLSKSMDVYGKLGVANEMVKVSGDTAGVDNNHAILPEMGLGISYFPTEKLSLNFAIYQTLGDDVAFTYSNVNNLPSIFTALFGVSYYFA